ncbi:DUF1822 family protein [Geminocystis sp. NIES-3709]|uniref:DUF1822 family protein n=1 Tax=Geminocystis sp. NIES-3709 TaxID=1617448 RepID=UPI0005FC8EF9|nr:DUF1822 family protein [Geminocystis sp. NIES-3709]BAQ65279.1 hypothetical protein GM3709_2044 [Geminocystis sp. NIES-3709]
MTNLTFIDTAIDEIKIQLTDEIKNNCWEKTNCLSNDVTCFRGYLNLLVRNTFCEWLNLMLDINFIDEMALEDNLSIWEFINGNAINIDLSQIVLIPIETQDKTEFSIPEEWLKIPLWVGNYYIPVEVNLEENYLSFWGYVSHEDVLSYGKLDSFNHCIDFPSECLETDLNLLCLEYEYGWDSIPQIQPLSILSSQEKENLFTTIQDKLSPRIFINFNQWLSFISDNSTRHQLFLNRQSLNLSQWLYGQFSDAIIKGWQSLEELKERYFVPDFTLSSAVSFRSLSITESLKILQKNLDRGLISCDQVQVNNILKTLSNLVINNEIKSQIITTLVNFINHEEDEEIRWNAALALQKLDRNHPNSPIWQGKIINLENYDLGLLVSILPKNNQKIDIFIRVYCLDKNIYLPNNLILQIIDDSNNIFTEIITENNDTIIQYKFWGIQSEHFKIKLILRFSYIEEFFCI